MRQSSGRHLIFGTGPAAAAAGRALISMDQDVLFANRSGSHPGYLPAGADLIRADARDRSAVMEAAGGATVLYNCLNVPYQHWGDVLPACQETLLAVAEEVRANYVALENMYGYGNVQGALREDLPLEAHTKKGALRAEMSERLMEAHHQGRARVTIGRASDFYGPAVTNSFLGERTFAPLVQGKPAQVMGDPDLPHSFAYVRDVGRGLATLGTNSRALGEAWHLPHAAASTTREMLLHAFDLVGHEPRLRTLGRWSLRLAGLLIPEARESIELLYEFESPFVVDDSKFHAAFDLTPTSIPKGISETVAWYQAHYN